MPLDNFGRLIDAALTWDDLGNLLENDLAEIKPAVKKMSEKAEDDSDTQDDIKEATEDTSATLKKLASKFDKALILLSKLTNRNLKKEAEEGQTKLRQAANFIDQPREKREQDRTKLGWDLTGISKSIEAGLKSVTDSLQNAFRTSQPVIPVQPIQSSNIVPVMNKLITTVSAGLNSVVDKLEEMRKNTTVNVHTMPSVETDPGDAAEEIKKAIVDHTARVQTEATVKIESDIDLPDFGKENILLLRYVEVNDRPLLEFDPIPIEYFLQYKEGPGDPPGIGMNSGNVLRIPGIVSLELDPESKKILALLEKEWTLKVSKIQVRVTGGGEEPPLGLPAPRPPQPGGGGPLLIGTKDVTQLTEEAGRAAGILREFTNAVTGLTESVKRAADDVQGISATRVAEQTGARPPPTAVEPIPKLAKGGIVKRPTTALIGEAGPEAVIPLDKLPLQSIQSQPVPNLPLEQTVPPVPVQPFPARTVAQPPVKKKGVGALIDTVDNATNVPVLKQCKEVNKVIMQKFYGFLEKRYGPMMAKLILASGQGVGWGAMGLGALMGMPIILPGASLWGGLPIIGILELAKFINSQVNKRRKKNAAAGAPGEAEIDLDQIIESIPEDIIKQLPLSPEINLEMTKPDEQSNALPLKRFAKGGIVKGPTAAMIGEAGPEAVIPLGELPDPTLAIKEGTKFQSITATEISALSSAGLTKGSIFVHDEMTHKLLTFLGNNAEERKQAKQALADAVAPQDKTVELIEAVRSLAVPTTVPAAPAPAVEGGAKGRRKAGAAAPAATVPEVPESLTASFTGTLIIDVSKAGNIILDPPSEAFIGKIKKAVTAATVAIDTATITFTGSLLIDLSKIKSANIALEAPSEAFIVRFKKAVTAATVAIDTATINFTGALSIDITTAESIAVAPSSTAFGRTVKTEIEGGDAIPIPGTLNVVVTGTFSPVPHDTLFVIEATKLRAGIVREIKKDLVATPVEITATNAFSFAVAGSLTPFLAEKALGVSAEDADLLFAEINFPEIRDEIAKKIRSNLRGVVLPLGPVRIDVAGSLTPVLKDLTQASQADQLLASDEAIAGVINPKELQTDISELIKKELRGVPLPLGPVNIPVSAKITPKLATVETTESESDADLGEGDIERRISVTKLQTSIGAKIRAALRTEGLELGSIWIKVSAKITPKLTTVVTTELEGDADLGDGDIEGRIDLTKLEASIGAKIRAELRGGAPLPLGSVWIQVTATITPKLVSLTTSDRIEDADLATPLTTINTVTISDGVKEAIKRKFGVKPIPLGKNIPVTVSATIKATLELATDSTLSEEDNRAIGVRSVALSDEVATAIEKKLAATPINLDRILPVTITGEIKLTVTSLAKYIQGIRTSAFDPGELETLKAKAEAFRQSKVTLTNALRDDVVAKLEAEIIPLGNKTIGLTVTGKFTVAATNIASYIEQIQESAYKPEELDQLKAKAQKFHDSNVALTDVFQRDIVDKLESKPIHLGNKVIGLQVTGNFKIEVISLSQYIDTLKEGEYKEKDIVEFTDRLTKFHESTVAVSTVLKKEIVGKVQDDPIDLGNKPIGLQVTGNFLVKVVSLSEYIDKLKPGEYKDEDIEDLRNRLTKFYEATVAISAILKSEIVTKIQDQIVDLGNKPIGLQVTGNFLIKVVSLSEYIDKLKPGEYKDEDIEDLRNRLTKFHESTVAVSTVLKKEIVGKVQDDPIDLGNNPIGLQVSGNFEVKIISLSEYIDKLKPGEYKDEDISELKERIRKFNESTVAVSALFRDEIVNKIESQTIELGDKPVGLTVKGNFTVADLNMADLVKSVPQPPTVEDLAVFNLRISEFIKSLSPLAQQIDAQFALIASKLEEFNRGKAQGAERVRQAVTASITETNLQVGQNIPLKVEGTLTFTPEGIDEFLAGVDTALRGLEGQFNALGQAGMKIDKAKEAIKAKILEQIQAQQIDLGTDVEVSVMGSVKPILKPLKIGGGGKLQPYEPAGSIPAEIGGEYAKKPRLEEVTAQIERSPEVVIDKPEVTIDTSDFLGEINRQVSAAITGVGGQQVKHEVPVEITPTITVKTETIISGIETKFKEFTRDKVVDGGNVTVNTGATTALTTTSEVPVNYQAPLSLTPSRVEVKPGTIILDDGTDLIPYRSPVQLIPTEGSNIDRAVLLRVLGEILLRTTLSEPSVGYFNNLTFSPTDDIEPTIMPGILAELLRRAIASTELGEQTFEKAFASIQFHTQMGTVLLSAEAVIFDDATKEAIAVQLEALLTFEAATLTLKRLVVRAESTDIQGESGMMSVAGGKVVIDTSRCLSVCDSETHRLLTMSMTSGIRDSGKDVADTAGTPVLLDTTKCLWVCDTETHRLLSLIGHITPAAAPTEEAVSTRAKELWQKAGGGDRTEAESASFWNKAVGMLEAEAQASSNYVSVAGLVANTMDVRTHELLTEISGKLDPVIEMSRAALDPGSIYVHDSEARKFLQTIKEILESVHADVISVPDAATATPAVEVAAPAGPGVPPTSTPAPVPDPPKTFIKLKELADKQLETAELDVSDALKRFGDWLLDWVHKAGASNIQPGTDVIEAETANFHKQVKEVFELIGPAMNNGVLTFSDELLVWWNNLKTNLAPDQMNLGNIMEHWLAYVTKNAERLAALQATPPTISVPAPTGPPVAPITTVETPKEKPEGEKIEEALKAAPAPKEAKDKGEDKKVKKCLSVCDYTTHKMLQNIQKILVNCCKKWSGEKEEKKTEAAAAATTAVATTAPATAAPKPPTPKPAHEEDTPEGKSRQIVRDAIHRVQGYLDTLTNQLLGYNPLTKVTQDLVKNEQEFRRAVDETLYTQQGITMNQREIQHQYELGADTVAGQVERFRDIAKITGQDINTNMKVYVKLLRMGIKDQKLAERQMINANNLARQIGANVEETGEMFGTWTNELGMSGNQGAQMARTMVEIGRSTGLSGDNLLRATKASGDLLKTLRNAGTLSQETARNFMLLSAGAQKVGIGDEMNKFLRGIASGVDFLHNMDAGMRNITSVMAGHSGKDGLLNEFIMGRGGQRQNLMALAQGYRNFISNFGRNMGLDFELTTENLARLTDSQRLILDNALNQMSQGSVRVGTVGRFVDQLEEAGRSFDQRMARIRTAMDEAGTATQRQLAQQQQQEIVTGELFRGLTRVQELTGKTGGNLSEAFRLMTTEGENFDESFTQVLRHLRIDTSRGVDGLRDSVTETFNRVRQGFVDAGKESEFTIDATEMNAVFDDMAAGGARAAAATDRFNRLLTQLNAAQQQVSTTKAATQNPMTQLDQTIRELNAILQGFTSGLLRRFIDAIGSTGLSLIALGSAVAMIFLYFIDFQKTLAQLGQTFGTAGKAGGLLGNIMWAIVHPFQAIGAAAKGVAYSLGYLAGILPSIGLAFKNIPLFRGISEAFAPIFAAIRTGVGALPGLVMKFFGLIGGMFAKLGRWLLTFPILNEIYSGFRLAGALIGIAFRDLGSVIAGWASGLWGLIGRLFSPIGRLFGVIGNWFAKLGPLFYEIYAGFRLAGALIGIAFRDLAGVIGGWGVRVAEFFGPVVRAIGTFFGRIGKGILDTIAPLLNLIGGKLSGLFGGFKFSEMFAGLGASFQAGKAGGIANAAGGLTKAFGPIGTAFKTFGKILGKLAGPLTLVMGLFEAFTNPLKKMVDGTLKEASMLENITFGLLTGGTDTGSMLSGWLGIDKGSVADEAMGIMGAVAQGASVGFLVGGPWGAAIGALIGLLVELYKISEYGSSSLRKSLAYFRSWIKDIQNLVMGFVDLFRGVWDVIVGMFKGDNDLIQQGMNKIGNAVLSILKNLLLVLLKGVDLAIQGLVWLITNLPKFIFDALGNLISRWLPATAEFVKKVGELLAAVGKIIGGIWDMIAGLFSLDFGRFVAGFKAAIWNLIVPLLDAFSAIPEMTLEWIQTLGRFLLTFPDMIRNWAKQIDFKAVGKSLVEAITNAVKDLIVALGTMFKTDGVWDWAKIGKWLGKVALGIGIAFLVALVGLPAIITGALYALGGYIIAVLGEVILKGIGDLVAGIGDALMEIPGLQFLGAIFRGLGDMLTSLGTILGGLVDIVGGLIGGLFTGDWSKAGQKMWDGLKKVLGGLGGLVLGLLQTIIPGIIMGALQLLADALLGIVYGAVALFGAITGIDVSSWLTGLEKAFEWVHKLVKDVSDWFKWLYDLIVGHSIIPDLVNAIVWWFGGLFDVVHSFIRAVKGIFALDFGEYFGGIVQMYKSFARLPFLVLKGMAGIGKGIATAVRDWLGGIIDSLKGTFIGNLFGDTFANVSGWLNNVVSAFEGLGTYFSGVLDVIQGIFSWDWGKVRAGYAKMAEGAWNFVKSFIQVIWKLPSMISQAIYRLGAFIANAIGDWLTGVSEALADTPFGRFIGNVAGFFKDLGQYFTGLATYFQGVIDVISGIFSWDWSLISKGIGKMWDGLWKAVLGLGKLIIKLPYLILEGLASLGEVIYDAASGWLRSISEALGGEGTFLGALFATFSDMAAGLSRIFKGLKDIFGGVIEFFTALFSWDMGKMSAAAGRIWEGIKNIFGGLWDYLIAIPSRIINWFRSIDWGEVGESIRSFFAGLPDQIRGWIKGIDFKGFGKGIVKWIKNIPAMISNAFSSLFGGGEAFDFKTFSAGLIKGIKNGIKSVVDWFKNIDWKAVAEWIKQVPGKIVDFIKNTDWTAVLKGIGIALLIIFLAIPAIIIGLAWTILGAIGEGIFGGISEALNEWADELDGYFGGFIRGIAKIFEGLGEIFGGFSEIGEGILSLDLDKILGGLSRIGGGILMIFEGIGQALWNAIGGLGEMILSAWGWVVESVLGFFGIDATGFTDTIVAAWNGFIDFMLGMPDRILEAFDFTALWDHILGYLSGIGDFFSALFSWDLDGMADAAGKIFENLMGIFTDLGTGIANLFDGILQDLFGVSLGDLSSMLGLDTIWEGMQQVFGGISEFFSGLFNWDWDQMLAGLGNIGEGLFDMIWGALQGLINIGTPIWDGIVEFFSTIDWGGIFGGLWEGLQNLGTMFMDFLGDIGKFLKSLWDGVWGFIRAIPGMFMNLIRNIGTFFGGLIGRISSAVLRGVQWIGAKIRDIMEAMIFGIVDAIADLPVIGRALTGTRDSMREAGFGSGRHAAALEESRARDDAAAAQAAADAQATEEARQRAELEQQATREAAERLQQIRTMGDQLRTTTGVNAAVAPGAQDTEAIRGKWSSQDVARFRNNLFGSNPTTTRTITRQYREGIDAAAQAASRSWTTLQAARTERDTRLAALNRPGQSNEQITAASQALAQADTALGDATRNYVGAIQRREQIEASWATRDQVLFDPRKESMEQLETSLGRLRDELATGNVDQRQRDMRSADVREKLIEAVNANGLRNAQDINKFGTMFREQMSREQLNNTVASRVNNKLLGENTTWQQKEAQLMQELVTLQREILLARERGDWARVQELIGGIASNQDTLDRIAAMQAAATEIQRRLRTATTALRDDPNIVRLEAIIASTAPQQGESRDEWTRQREAAMVELATRRQALQIDAARLDIWEQAVQSGRSQEEMTNIAVEMWRRTLTTEQLLQSPSALTALGFRDMASRTAFVDARKMELLSSMAHAQAGTGQYAGINRATGRRWTEAEQQREFTRLGLEIAGLESALTVATDHLAETGGLIARSAGWVPGVNPDQRRQSRELAPAMLWHVIRQNERTQNNSVEALRYIIGELNVRNDNVVDAIRAETSGPVKTLMDLVARRPATTDREGMQEWMQTVRRTYTAQYGDLQRRWDAAFAKAQTGDVAAQAEMTEIARQMFLLQKANVLVTTQPALLTQLGGSLGNLMRAANDVEQTLYNFEEAIEDFTYDSDQAGEAWARWQLALGRATGVQNEVITNLRTLAANPLWSGLNRGDFVHNFRATIREAMPPQWAGEVDAGILEQFPFMEQRAAHVESLIAGITARLAGRGGLADRRANWSNEEAQEFMALQRRLIILENTRATATSPGAAAVRDMQTLLGVDPANVAEVQRVQGQIAQQLALIAQGRGMPRARVGATTLPGYAPLGEADREAGTFMPQVIERLVDTFTRGMGRSFLLDRNRQGNAAWQALDIRDPGARATQINRRRDELTANLRAAIIAAGERPQPAQAEQIRLLTQQLAELEQANALSASMSDGIQQLRRGRAGEAGAMIEFRNNFTRMTTGVNDFINRQIAVQTQRQSITADEKRRLVETATPAINRGNLSDATVNPYALIARFGTKRERQLEYNRIIRGLNANMTVAFNAWNRDRSNQSLFDVYMDAANRVAQAEEALSEPTNLFNEAVDQFRVAVDEFRGSFVETDPARQEQMRQNAMRLMGQAANMLMRTTENLPDFTSAMFGQMQSLLTNPTTGRVETADVAAARIQGDIVAGRVDAAIREVWMDPDAFANFEADYATARNRALDLLTELYDEDTDLSRAEEIRAILADDQNINRFAPYERALFESTQAIRDLQEELEAPDLADADRERILGQLETEFGTLNTAMKNQAMFQLAARNPTSLSSPEALARVLSPDAMQRSVVGMVRSLAPVLTAQQLRLTQDFQKLMRRPDQGYYEAPGADEDDEEGWERWARITTARQTWRDAQLRSMQTELDAAIATRNWTRAGELTMQMDQVRQVFSHITSDAYLGAEDAAYDQRATLNRIVTPAATGPALTARIDPQSLGQFTQDMFRQWGLGVRSPFFNPTEADRTSAPATEMRTALAHVDMIEQIMEAFGITRTAQQKLQARLGAVQGTMEAANRRYWTTLQRHNQLVAAGGVGIPDEVMEATRQLISLNEMATASIPGLRGRREEYQRSQVVPTLPPASMPTQAPERPRGAQIGSLIEDVGKRTTDPMAFRRGVEQLYILGRHFPSLVRPALERGMFQARTAGNNDMAQYLAYILMNLDRAREIPIGQEAQAGASIPMHQTMPGLGGTRTTGGGTTPGSVTPPAAEEGTEGNTLERLIRRMMPPTRRVGPGAGTGGGTGGGAGGGTGGTGTGTGGTGGGTGGGPGTVVQGMGGGGGLMPSITPWIERLRQGMGGGGGPGQGGVEGLFPLLQRGLGGFLPMNAQPGGQGGQGGGMQGQPRVWRPGMPMNPEPLPLNNQLRPFLPRVAVPVPGARRPIGPEDIRATWEADRGAEIPATDLPQPLQDQALEWIRRLATARVLRVVRVADDPRQPGVPQYRLQEIVEPMSAGEQTKWIDAWRMNQDVPVPSGPPFFGVPFTGTHNGPFMWQPGMPFQREMFTMPYGPGQVLGRAHPMLPDFRQAMVNLFASSLGGGQPDSGLQDRDFGNFIAAFNTGAFGLSTAHPAWALVQQDALRRRLPTTTNQFYLPGQMAGEFWGTSGQTWAQLVDQDMTLYRRHAPAFRQERDRLRPFNRNQLPERIRDIPMYNPAVDRPFAGGPAPMGGVGGMGGMGGVGGMGGGGLQQPGGAPWTPLFPQGGGRGGTNPTENAGDVMPAGILPILPGDLEPKAVGTPMVTESGPAYLHRGEAILPATMARMWYEAMGTYRDRGAFPAGGGAGMMNPMSKAIAELVEAVRLLRETVAAMDRSNPMDRFGNMNFAWVADIIRREFGFTANNWDDVGNLPGHQRNALAEVISRQSGGRFGDKDLPARRQPTLLDTVLRMWTGLLNPQEETVQPEWMGAFNSLSTLVGNTWALLQGDIRKYLGGLLEGFEEPTAEPKKTDTEPGVTPIPPKRMPDVEEEVRRRRAEVADAQARATRSDELDEISENTGETAKNTADTAKVMVAVVRLLDIIRRLLSSGSSLKGKKINGVDIAALTEGLDLDEIINTDWNMLYNESAVQGIIVNKS